MYAENVRTTLLIMILAVLVGSALQAVGQVLVTETDCHPSGHRRFVRDSLEQAKDGARIPSVVDTLSCIARTNRGGRNVNTSAVRAGFVIADEEGVAGQFLLSVIQDSQTPVPAQRLACQLVRYVANPDIEAAMFRTFKDTWASDHSVIFFEVFRAMRNLEFLAWVDEQLALDTQVSVSRQSLEREAELIRVQQDREQVIQYITSSERKILYRVWLTRHALRCGLTRAELRRAFLPMFQQKPPTRNDLYEQLELLEALDELKVFGDEDEAILKRLRDIRSRVVSCFGDSAPRWSEEIIAAKRAAFLGMSNRTGSGQ